ncbi:saccharopine dehydrogenase family protein [Streptomyces coeruleorubidus]|uniref:saccharopine dehydrogenase n=1 Tax=Streptomyces coeruleorubidus TaxID=116188 RepID=UPI003684F144
MDDDIQLDVTGPVLVVGGYGTVGGDLARLAAPSWPLLLTGRSPERGRALAEEVGASVRRWDVGDPEPFSARVRAVISTVNDPDDRVLRAALHGGVPYVDITRWTARLQRAAAITALTPPKAPVLLSSSWMGGVSALVAAALAADLGGAAAVEVAIRYDLKDRAGTDSVEFMDRLGLDFEVMEDGQRRMIMPLSGAGYVTIGEHRTKVARIDTPEQFTLPLTLGVDTAVTRIGFSANSSTSALLALKKTGFFRWGRGDRLESVRRSLLYSPGEGGEALLRIDVRGRDGGRRTAMVRDTAGQAHLTALGGLLGLRRVLGEDGSPAPEGVVFAEQTPSPREVIPALEKAGIEVTVS